MADEATPSGKNRPGRQGQLVPWLSRLRRQIGRPPAGAARGNKSLTAPTIDTPKIAGPVSTSVRDDGRDTDAFARRVKWSFALAVLLPALIYLIYTAAIATPVYVSEFKLVVRSAERNESLKDGLSSLTRLARVETSGSHQDAQIVLSYVKSRAMIEDLGGRDALMRHYGRRQIDYFSRLGADEPIEDVLEYWISRVTATIDSLTGIVTVRVRAFSADEAKDLAARIVRNSEALINRLSERTRQDAQVRAEAEIDRATGILAQTRQELLEFRNRSGSIDPVDDVKSIGSVILALTLQKAEMEAQATSMVGTIDPNSVVERQRRAQIDSLTEKIDELKAKLTSREANDAVSQKLKEFEQIKLRVVFAEKIYELSQKEYETARKDLAKQQLFVATIVAPTLADAPTYPKVLAESFLVFIVLTVGWGIIVLLVASVLDHSY